MSFPTWRILQSCPHVQVGWRTYSALNYLLDHPSAQLSRLLPIISGSLACRRLPQECPCQLLPLLFLPKCSHPALPLHLHKCPIFVAMESLSSPCGLVESPPHQPCWFLPKYIFPQLSMKQMNSCQHHLHINSFTSSIFIPFTRQNPPLEILTKIQHVHKIISLSGQTPS